MSAQAELDERGDGRLSGEAFIGRSDWLKYFLDLPVLHEPGAVAAYCTMGQVLATETISLAAGMPIERFADQYLFDPLGIENLNWGHTSRRVKLQSAKRLYMTPRDMAKNRSVDSEPREMERRTNRL
jgi:CubicO group peptidase (beta-lactamase class C family)